MKAIQLLLAILITVTNLSTSIKETRSTWVALSYGYNSQGKAIISSELILIKNCEATDDIIGRVETLRPIAKKISNDMKSNYSSKLSNGHWKTEFFSSVEEHKTRLNKIKSKIGGVKIVSSITVFPPNLKYSCNNL